MGTRRTCCPRDCPRRAVGCRADCPDWQEHEKRKAERYEQHRREIASYPAHIRREQNVRHERRRQLKT